MGQHLVADVRPSRQRVVRRQEPDRPGDHVAPRLGVVVVQQVVVRLMDLERPVFTELRREVVGAAPDRQGDDVAERASKRQCLQRRRSDRPPIVLDQHEHSGHGSTPMSANTSTTAPAASRP